MATLRQQIATNVLTVTRFRDLLRKVRSYRPAEDLSSIKKAYEFSQEHHKGQARESGEPYLAHLTSEQGFAQPMLKRADLMADRRRGHRKCTRRRLEAARDARGVGSARRDPDAHAEKLRFVGRPRQREIEAAC